MLENWLLFEQLIGQCVVTTYRNYAKYFSRISHTFILTATAAHLGKLAFAVFVPDSTIYQLVETRTDIGNYNPK